jgi:hypothetical protein
MLSKIMAMASAIFLFGAVGSRAGSREIAKPVFAKPVFAKPVSQPVSKPVYKALDTAAVRKLYLDGDFEEAIKMLDGVLKEKRALTHEDSVLIFKHLGVMYAANYETREKGKYYMHQLLMVEPTARIMDMYASDMIYMIFKNIQDEFESSRAKLDRAESHVIGNSQSQAMEKPIEKPVSKQPDPPHGHQAYYWLGATGAVAVAGVVAYVVLSNQDPKIVQADHPVTK